MYNFLLRLSVFSVIKTRMIHMSCHLLLNERNCYALLSLSKLFSKNLVVSVFKIIVTIN
jgi:hypothetical protein